MTDLTGEITAVRDLTADISRPREISVEIVGRGATGKSAYEFALEGGYSGSEDDFRRAMSQLGVQSVYSASTYLEFPSVGQDGIIYIDTTANKTYRFDEEGLKYYVIGSDYNDIKVIRGGSL